MLDLENDETQLILLLYNLSKKHKFLPLCSKWDSGWRVICQLLMWVAKFWLFVNRLSLFQLEIVVRGTKRPNNWVEIDAYS